MEIEARKKQEQKLEWKWRPSKNTSRRQIINWLKTNGIIR